jgi:hypothetical protein
MRKTYFLFQLTLSILFLWILTVISVYSQHIEKANKTAKITLTMPLAIPGEDSSLPGGNLEFKVFLVSPKMNKQFHIVRRKPIGDFGNYVDTYEIVISPGVYGLKIKNEEHFRLPNFYVGANEDYNVYLPKNRVIAPRVCMNDDIYVKVLDAGESDREYKRKYQDDPWHELETEVVGLHDPFEAVINYCRKDLQDDKVLYKGVTFYYKNTYVEAQELSIDRKRRKVEALADYIEIAGVHQNSTRKKFEFFY